MIVYGSTIFIFEKHNINIDTHMNIYLYKHMHIHHILMSTSKKLLVNYNFKKMGRSDSMRRARANAG
jgi:hypothetical protein